MPAGHSSERPAKKCPHDKFHNRHCVQCGGWEREDLTGQTFNQLTVIRMLPGVRCLVRCTCGKIKATVACHVKKGRIRSCGCYFNVGRRLKHGLAKDPAFHPWQIMLQRCYNPKDDHYPQYGARGIAVYEEWRKSFPAFLAHIGPRPSPAHSIDRFPNRHGNYEPGNVRWATPRQQSLNRDNVIYLEFNGVRKALSEWAEELNICPATLRYRFLAGWPAEKTLTTPGRKRWTRT